MAETAGPMPVVLTGEGKFFSNGFDLEALAGAPAGAADLVVARFQGLLVRLLRSPCYTVAAVNGHAFAAGAMVALACDERVMRADRGWFCLPEVTLGLPFTPGMSAIITSKLGPRSAHRAMLTGRRYDASAAAADGLIDETASAEELLERAVSMAEPMVGKPGPAVAAIRAEMYRRPIALLEGIDDERRP
jgi:enoyl-CoA hydratase/carnithine racemase